MSHDLTVLPIGAGHPIGEGGLAQGLWAKGFPYRYAVSVTVKPFTVAPSTLLWSV